MLIDVDGNRLTARFINEEGKVKDEFSIQKQNGITVNSTDCILKKEQQHQQKQQLQQKAVGQQVSA